jgi:hypothetical protein
MSHAIVRLRVTDATLQSAQHAARSGELIELRDKHGQLHKGWVRGRPAVQVLGMLKERARDWGSEPRESCSPSSERSHLTSLEW